METTLTPGVTPYVIYINYDNLESLEQRKELVWQKVKHQHQIKGFRPGLAPRAMIENKVGASTLYKDLLEEILIEGVSEIEQANETKIIEIKQAHIDVFEKDKALIMHAEVVLRPKVKSLNYKEITIPLCEKVKVDDEEVVDLIDQILESNATWDFVERESENGDRATISYEVSIEGSDLKDGPHKNYPFILGENKMLDEFEEQILGQKKGTEKTFSITFPSDYHKKELCNKKGNVQLKIEAIAEKNLPIISTAFFESNGFKTLQEMKDGLKSNLLEEKITNSKNVQEKGILNLLGSAVSIEPIPESMVEAQIERTLRIRLSSLNMTKEDFFKRININEEQYKIRAVNQALQEVKVQLALLYVAKDLEINPSDEEVDQYLTDDLKIPRDKQNNIEKKLVIDQMRMKQVLEWIKKNCQIAKPKEEKDVSQDSKTKK